MKSVPRETFQILLVEDNEADVFLLRRGLAQTGLRFDLHVIDNGADAIRFMNNIAPASDAIPDLAVLDLNLPGISGIEVLSKLRATPLLAEIPVCVVTSSNAAQDRAQTAQLGVSCYLVKPPDLEGMLAIGPALRDALLHSRASPASA
jgi:chemotaxis family two-component system response regulator Rcp1